MRLAVAGVGAVLVAAVLAGCSDSEQASTTLPSTSSAAASPTSTLPPLGPADFPMPAEAREQNDAGASAFATYYIQLVNRLNQDMDTQYLTALSDGCATCERIIRVTNSDAAKGYRYEGGETTVRGQLQAVVTGPGTSESAFIMDQAALRVLDPGGQEVAEASVPAQSGISAGTRAEWDPSLRSWKLTEFTAG